jgi:hypothetical protein
MRSHFSKCAPKNRRADGRNVEDPGIPKAIPPARRQPRIAFGVGGVPVSCHHVKIKVQAEIVYDVGHRADRPTTFVARKIDWSAHKHALTPSDPILGC